MSASLPQARTTANTQRTSLDFDELRMYNICDAIAKQQDKLHTGWVCSFPTCPWLETPICNNEVPVTSSLESAQAWARKPSGRTTSRSRNASCTPLLKDSADMLRMKAIFAERYSSIPQGRNLQPAATVRLLMQWCKAESMSSSWIGRFGTSDKRMPKWMPGMVQRC